MQPQSWDALTHTYHPRLPDLRGGEASIGQAGSATVPLERNFTVVEGLDGFRLHFKAACRTGEGLGFDSLQLHVLDGDVLGDYDDS